LGWAVAITEADEIPDIKFWSIRRWVLSKKKTRLHVKIGFKVQIFGYLLLSMCNQQLIELHK